MRHIITLAMCLLSSEHPLNSCQSFSVSIHSVALNSLELAILRSEIVSYITLRPQTGLQRIGCDLAPPGPPLICLFTAGVNIFAAGRG